MKVPFMRLILSILEQKQAKHRYRLFLWSKRYGGKRESMGSAKVSVHASMVPQSVDSCTSLYIKHLKDILLINLEIQLIQP